MLKRFGLALIVCLLGVAMFGQTGGTYPLGPLTTKTTGVIPLNGYFALPPFTTGALPTPTSPGVLVWNTTTNSLYQWDGSAWSKSGLDTSQSYSWTAPQEFDAGFVAGGTDTSDTLPLDTTLSALSAYPGASVNTTGGNIYLAGGLGSQTITISDYTQLTGTFVSFDLNLGTPGSLAYTLTEGIEFSAVTDNNTTALALATAINAWCPGIHGEAVGPTVLVSKTAGTVSIGISASSVDYVVAQGGSGDGYLVGRWHTIGEFARDGEVLATFYSWSPGLSETTLNAVGKSYMDISCSTPWSPSSISGATTGKILTLTFEDSNFSLPNSAPYSLAGAFTSSPKGTLVLQYDGTVWREISRSPQAADSAKLGGQLPAYYQTAVAPGTSGNVLTSNGSAWTSAAPPSAAPGGSSGAIQGNTSGAFAGIPGATYDVSTGAITLTAGAATTTPLTVQGAAGQSADLLDVKNSSGTTVASVNYEGGIYGQYFKVPNGSGLVYSSYSGFVVASSFARITSPADACVVVDSSNNSTSSRFVISHNSYDWPSTENLLFSVDESGLVTTTGPMRLTAYTVATLPAGTAGDTCYVTDATSPTYLGTLTGGGSVVCPVFFNGTAWVAH